MSGRAFCDCARFIMGCSGEGSKTRKGREQRGLERNKQGKTKEKGDKKVQSCAVGWSALLSGHALHLITAVCLVCSLLSISNYFPRCRDLYPVCTCVSGGPSAVAGVGPGVSGASMSVVGGTGETRERVHCVLVCVSVCNH